MRTVADYRQLNDALFHAGLDSGSEYEWEDTPNRLHFYVIDLTKDKDGILSYMLAVRSLDGSGPQERGVTLSTKPDTRVEEPDTPVVLAPENTGKAPAAVRADGALPVKVVVFALKNTGKAPAGDAGAGGGHANSDVYRLSVSIEGKGWTAQLLNGLAAVEAGATRPVTVYVSHEDGSAKSAKVTLRATSESDPSKTATASVKVSR